MRIGLGIIALLVVIYVLPAQAMSVYSVYGEKDNAFIVSYNQRLLKDFLSYNEDFRKCLPVSLEEKIIKDILPKHTGWGLILAEGLAFIPHFEVFYRSVSKESNLEKGIRVEIPQGYEIKIGTHQVKTASNAFGFEIYLNHKGQCVENKIQKFMGHLLFGNNERLDIQAKVFPNVDKYPFYEFIKAEVGSKKDGSIIFLRSFNFLYLNTKVHTYVDHHQKEFQQFLLRLTWKSPDEFTVYFPQ